MLAGMKKVRTFASAIEKQRLLKEKSSLKDFR